MRRPLLFILVCLTSVLLASCAPAKTESSPTATSSPTTTPSATSPAVSTTPSPSATSPAPTATPLITTSPVSTLKADWVLVERPDDGFAVALPKAWKSLDLSLSQYDSMRAMGFLFFATDPELNPATTRAPGSFSVARKALNTPVTLDALASSELKSLESATNMVKPVAVELAKLPLGDVVRMQYQKNMTRTGGQIETMVFLQYAVLRGNDIYLFTFETVPAISEKYLPIFEEIAKSFRFTK